MENDNRKFAAQPEMAMTRTPRAVFAVEGSARTVTAWIHENINVAPPEKLYEALGTAIKMRDGQ